MRLTLLLLSFLSTAVFANQTDYWSKDKEMDMPSGIATTACSFYNSLDPSDNQTALMNELYKRWLKGWVSSFIMYSDWDIRKIEDTEYIGFIRSYCSKFPQNTIGMAAHTFTYKVKK